MFDLKNYAYIKFINPFEWVMLGIFLLLILVPTFLYQASKVKQDNLYRYYMPGLLLKLLSSVVFCLIYIYYYNGGDTISYYETSRALVNLGLERPGDLVTVMTSHSSVENYYLFDGSTGYPWPYMYYDSQTFFVAKLLSPILFVAFRSYLVASILLSWLSFFGIWKFFKLMCSYYPQASRYLAWSILFLPSALFWGSGILKDTFTFSAVCWFICGVEGFFIGKKRRLKNLVIIALAFYILVSVKPYVLIALFPGTLVWILYARMLKIRTRLIRVLFIPMIFLFSFGVGYFALSLLGDELGKFSVDKMLKTASITQNDLKQDYYNGSSFDIGGFEPTISGVLSKVPAAATVGLFRPFIWEARNVVMLVSGLENSVYLVLMLLLLRNMLRSTRKFFGILAANPIIIFLLSYSFFFSVMVGLSTSNFGALVRFKIPFLPAFVICLVVLNSLLGTFGVKQKRSRFTGFRNIPSGNLLR